MARSTDSQRINLNLTSLEPTPASRALTPTPDEALFADSPQTPPAKSRRGKNKKPAMPAITDVQPLAPPEAGQWVLPSAIWASVFWLGAVLGYQVGFIGVEGFARLSPLQWAQLLVVALAPVSFILSAAAMTQTALKLRQQTQAAVAAAERLSRPDFSATEEVATLGALIRGELSALDQGLERTIARLSTLERDVSKQAQSLTLAARDSQAAAEAVSQSLSRERDAMSGLVKQLDDKVAMIAEAIATQSRMVADASGLADAQMREAAQHLSAQAGQLTGAFREARDLGAEAAQAATDQAARLHAAAQTLAQERHAIDGSLGHMAAHQDRMLHASQQARSGHEMIVSETENSAEAFISTIAAAVEQARTLAGMAERERAINESTVRSALVRLEDMATAARQAAQTARAAVDEQADAALKRIENLGEATFELTARTDQTLEAQLLEARKLVERSAGAIDEAATRISQSLDAGLAGAKARLDALEQELSTLSTRLSDLPSSIAAQTAAVREVLASGLSDIHAEVRAAAEDARLLETEVDGRLKQHTALMSDMAAQLAPPDAPVVEEPAPVTPAAVVTPSPVAVPVPPSQAPHAGAPAPVSRDDWNWKQLLSGMDAPAQAEASEPVLQAIRAMGITVRAALPDALMRTLADIWRDGGHGAAMQTARRSAPASVRKITSRLAEDAILQQTAAQYVAAYGDVLQAARGGDTAHLEGLLFDDAARAFWLIGAALEAKS